MPASRSPTSPATATIIARGWSPRVSGGCRASPSSAGSTKRSAAGWAGRSTRSSSPPQFQIRSPQMSEANSKIDEIVQSNDVVLFMKGSALFPQCGFSARAISILDHLGVGFETVDVLQAPEIRQGIKAYSDWPTIPQLY